MVELTLTQQRGLLLGPCVKILLVKPRLVLEFA